MYIHRSAGPNRLKLKFIDEPRVRVLYNMYIHYLYVSGRASRYPGRITILSPQQTLDPEQNWQCATYSFSFILKGVPWFFEGVFLGRPELYLSVAVSPAH